jgi:hypothetical protein
MTRGSQRGAGRRAQRHAVGRPNADTAQAPGAPFFTRQDGILAGGFVLGTIALAQVDSRLARTFQDPDLQESTLVRRGASFFNFMGHPAPEIIGLSLYGIGRLSHTRPVAALGLQPRGRSCCPRGSRRRSRPRLAARGRLYADTVPGSFAFMRGFGDHDFQSFPSGHTATAFSVARRHSPRPRTGCRRRGGGKGGRYVVAAPSSGAPPGGRVPDVLGPALGERRHRRRRGRDVQRHQTVKYAYRHPTNRVDRCCSG